MVASSSPAPTADSLVDRAALAKLVLRIDPKGFKVFLRKFQSAVGTHYQQIIAYAIKTDNLEPVDQRAIELHGKVYDMLVGTFANEHDDILLDMETAAQTHWGRRRSYGSRLATCRATCRRRSAP